VAGAEAPARSQPAAYRHLAGLYDRMYTFKKYRAEAGILRRLARRYGPRSAARLVDVACGTGEHLRFLRRWYSVEGIDRSSAMLRIARAKNRGVRFRRADMRRFRLERPAEVLTCLFSAIGYLPDERALRSAFRNFYRNLAPGGVAFIEPWITPAQFLRRHIGLRVVRGRGWAIARMNIAHRSGAILREEMHYLVGDPRAVRHHVDWHRTRMVSHARLLQLLREVGFRARLDRRSMPLGRGLLIAVRPPSEPRGPRPSA
jgi:SAM-dependent methyltransferase